MLEAKHYEAALRALASDDDLLAAAVECCEDANADGLMAVVMTSAVIERESTLNDHADYLRDHFLESLDILEGLGK